MLRCALRSHFGCSQELPWEALEGNTKAASSFVLIWNYFWKLVKLRCSRGKLHLLIEGRRGNDNKSYSVEANVAFRILQSDEFERLKGGRKRWFTCLKKIDNPLHSLFWYVFAFCFSFSLSFFFFNALKKRGHDSSLASIRQGWISVGRPLAICVVWAAVTSEANALYVNRFWWPEPAWKIMRTREIVLFYCSSHWDMASLAPRVWWTGYCLPQCDSLMSVTLGKERVQRLLACPIAVTDQADRGKPQQEDRDIVWRQRHSVGNSSC